MLKQKFFIDFASKAGIQIIGALCGILVARLAGPEIVGQIAYATAYVSIFSFLTGIFGTAHIKIASEDQNVKDCNTTYIWLMSFSGLFYLIIVLGTFIIQKYIMHYSFNGNEQETVILITLTATVVSLFYGTSQTLFVARTEQARANIPDLMRAIIYNILRIVAVVAGYGTIALAGANLVSAVVILPIIIIFIRKLDFGKFNFQLAKQYGLISIPVISIVITNSIMLYSDKLILEYYSNAHEIGIYTAAYSIGGILILVGNTAGTVFFPMFSSLFSKNEYLQVVIKIRQFERFIFSFVLPLIITLSLFSYPVIVTLLGMNYEQSSGIFSILVFSSLFIIWGMPYGNVLSGLGLFWLGSLVNLVKFFLFISTLLLCIHPSLLNMGVKALAVTQVVINVFCFMAFYIIAYYKIKVQFLKEQVRVIIFWTFIYLSSFFLIMPIIKAFSVFVQALLIMPLFLILVLVLQIALGLIKMQDVKMLMQVLDLKKNFQYIRSEIKDHTHNEPLSGL